MAMPAVPPLPVSDADIEDLRHRVAGTRWGPDWCEEPWAAGTDAQTLRRLAARWADGYDWRAAERAILALPAVRTDVGRVPVHAFVFRAEQSGAVPLVLTNGWHGGGSLASRLSALAAASRA
jgi:hypothetical protein